MSLFSVGSVFILFQTTSQIATILNKLNYKRHLKRTNMEIFDKNIKQLSFSFFSWSKWRLDQIVYESCPLCPHENTKTNVSHKIDFKDFKTCQFLDWIVCCSVSCLRKWKRLPLAPHPASGWYQLYLLSSLMTNIGPVRGEADIENCENGKYFGRKILGDIVYWEGQSCRVFMACTGWRGWLA